MNRITQDPSKVGKAMRTIALRLTGTEASKSELEEDGEEVEGMITNVSKLRDVIMQATKVKTNNFKGFDILKDNGAYKSTYEILLGIAEIYQEIVENDERTGAKGANLLLETIAGKNRASIAASILQSPDMLKEAYAEAIDAEGSAEVENAKYIDSISGHLEKLKNAWQELWANEGNREFINTIIDFGTAILKAVNNLGLLKTAFLAIAGIDIFKFLANGGGLTGSIVNSILQTTTKSSAKEVIDPMVKIIKGANIGQEMTKKAADEIIAKGTGEVLGYEIVETMKKAGEKGAESFKSSFISRFTSQGLGKALSEGTSQATENIGKLKDAVIAAKVPIAGLAIAIGALVAAFKLVDIFNLNSSETAKEAKEIASSFREAQNTIKEHKQTIDELSTSYTELSKGVNITTNANLTLPEEEYQRYLDVCNQIAEMYPQLVTGYDLQGNAIVNLKQNVKDLTDALIAEQKEASKTFLAGGKKEGIFGWFKNLGNENSIRDNFNRNYKEYQNIQTLRDYFLGQDGVDLSAYEFFRADLLDKSFSGDVNATNLLTTLGKISNGLVDSDEKLVTFLKDLTNLEMPKEMQESMQQAQQTLFSNLTLNDEYWDLIYNDDKGIGKNATSLFTNIVNSMSPEQASKLLNSTDKEVEASVSNIVETIDELLKQTSNNVINSSRTLSNELQGITTFQDILDDISNYNVGEGILANAKMGDFKKIATVYKNAFIGAFANSDVDGAELFNSMFTDKGMLELNDRFEEVLRTSPITASNGKMKEQARDFFNALSQDEADAFIRAFDEAKNFEEVLQNYHNNLRVLASGAYEAVVNIEEATAAVNTLTSALSSSASGNGLSEEEIGNIKSLFQDVVDFDENKLLENTANGVHLNVEELERLHKEYADFNIKKQGKQLDVYNEKLEESTKELERLEKAWKDAKNADDKQRYADLYKGEQTVKQGIEDNINALQREIAQYASLTSAYNKYVQAQSSANENARYENIGSGYETTKDLIERGWIGQDDVRSYLNMFTQDDMMTASSEELYEVWNKIDDKVNSAGYSLKDFFTYDSNGKSTSDGIFNFLDTVKQAAKDTGKYSNETLEKLVSKDKDGYYSFDFDVIGGDNEIAELLGVDLSLIQAIIQAARDAGFEVQMTEALPGLESLTDKIRNARDRLKELGLSAEEINKYKVDLSLDFSDADTYNKATQDLLASIDEIKKSDMTPEVKEASLDYVNGQLDAIITKKALLSLPTSLSYNTSDVEAGFQSLYATMQNYWLLQNELEQRKTLGLDTTKNEADLKAMAKQIFGLLKSLDEADRKEIGLGEIDITDTEEGIKQIEDYLKEKDLELHIPTTIDNPNGDPTADIDSQKITIDVQFSMNGETVVIKGVNTINNALDSIPEEKTPSVNLNTEPAHGKVSALERDLEEELSTPKKLNVDDTDLHDASKQFNSLGGNTETVNLLIKDNITDASRRYDTYNNKLRDRTLHTTIYQTTITRTQASGTAYRPVSGSGGGGKTFKLDYNGTAHALGTAYARGTSGNWGVPEDQDALTGELGEELVVRNGHFFTVGSESAEMVHLQKGDINKIVSVYSDIYVKII